MGKEPMRIWRGLGAMLGKTRPGQSQSRTFLKVKIELLLSISEDTQKLMFTQYPCLVRKMVWKCLVWPGVLDTLTWWGKHMIQILNDADNYVVSCYCSRWPASSQAESWSSWTCQHWGGQGCRQSALSSPHPENLSVIFQCACCMGQGCQQWALSSL